MVHSLFSLFLSHFPTVRHSMTSPWPAVARVAQGLRAQDGSIDLKFQGHPEDVHTDHPGNPGENNPCLVESNVNKYI